MSRVRVAGTLLLLALVGLAVLRSHWGTRLDGFTVDEPWHIVAGTQYVRSGDFRLNPEHPPLTKLWVGLFMPAGFQVPPPAALQEKAAERELVEQVMYLENDAAAAQQRARLAMWTLHGLMLLGLGLLLWRAFGLAWSAGTLAVLALEPTVAAHLPVVMTDLTLALALAIAVLGAGLLAATWQWRWVLATGLGIALALGAKHSALAGLAGLALLLAAAALLGLRHGGAREVLRRGARVAAAGALGLLLLWAQYGLRFHAGPDGSDAFNRAMPDKIADLNLPGWREGIALADRWRLLPRAYLWGLADTVRAGVEGRGQSMHLVWGHWHAGSAPWFTWPSVVVSKLPLATLALLLLGAILLAVPRWRGVPLAASMRWSLGGAALVAVLHLGALMQSEGTYGGVRHAMPLVVLPALLAGLVVATALRRRSMLLGISAALLLLATAVMTLPERRLWEYHNELVGGSDQAWRYFANEGTDLGQRFPEIRSFHDRVIRPTGLPLYSAYWFGEEQAEAAKLNYRRRVQGLQDENVEGVYEGFFVYPMPMTLPAEHLGWDPKEAFGELTLVERMGHIGIWRGRQVMPKIRAHGLYMAAVEHLYQQQGSDHASIAARLGEALPQLPFHVGIAIELGNARLRLGQREAAAEAYRTPLTQEAMPVDPLVRAQIEAQLARLADPAVDLAAVTPLRNPWME